MSQKIEIRKDNHGRDMKVPVREALDVNSESARYPGFRPEKLLLKRGSIRLKGYRPLPCDIILERDAAITLRDGVIIYTDIFRPADDQKHPAIMPDEKPEMYTIGGAEMFGGGNVSNEVETQDLPKDVNCGRHVIHAGGQYDSYLYVPVVSEK